MSAALNRFILKKLIHITSYCLRNLQNELLEIPPLTSLCGYGIFGVVVIEALPDDSGSPGDVGEQFVGCFVWLNGQV